MDLSKNSMYHAHIEHFNIRYHWLLDVIEEKRLNLKKVHINKNNANMLTKVFPGSKVELCNKLVGMRTSDHECDCVFPMLGWSGRLLWVSSPLVAQARLYF